MEAGKCEARGDADREGVTPASASETQDVFSGCGYEAVNWTTTAHAATCSTNTTATQTAECRRSDGQIVDAAMCTTRGVSLTRQVTGQTNLSGCSYSAQNWTTSSYGSSCSSNTTANQTAQCVRSDGTPAAASECTSRGIQLTRAVPNQQNYQGCTYQAGGWSVTGYSSNCASSTYAYEQASCYRSDGNLVSSGECTSRGISLSRQTSAGARYGSCTYTMWDGGAGACVNGQRPHYWGCRRNETGENVYSGHYCGRENPTYEAC